jgi:hypothetical protein
VDLFHLRSAKTILQFKIIKTAERIATMDEEACVVFEAWVLSMYQQFQIERRDIIADIN